MPKSKAKNPVKSVQDTASGLINAGIGAITKAQEESTKAIESLVKEGQDIQERSVKFADQKMGEVTDKVSKLAGSMSTRATQHWDKLEQVFEERVERALSRLGVPTNKDIQQLSERIESLSAAIAALTDGKPAPTKKTTTSRTKKA